MAVFVSPGVYVQEFDFSAFPARTLSTVVGIVGTAPKGPVNVPTPVTGTRNAQETFGRPLPTAGNRGNFGLHALYNLLNEVSLAYYVRVTDGTEETADLTTPIIINNQVVYRVQSGQDIVVDNGKINFLLEVRIKSGTEIDADAFDLLVRTFGAKNIIDGNYNQITNLSQLIAEISGGSPQSPAGTGAFIQIGVTMSGDTVEYTTPESFVSRFNFAMAGRAIRADLYTVGINKYIAFKTQNLAQVLDANFEFIMREQTGDFAEGSLVSTGTNNDLDFTAKNAGVTENAITVTLVDTGSLSVSVSGKAITVNINEGVTTAAEVINAIQNSSAANLLVAVANAAGDDGSGTVEAGTISLTGGGQNLPAEFTPDSLSYVSTTWAQKYSDDALQLRLEASSPGEFANSAWIEFGKTDRGYSITYREQDVSEGAIDLVIQPSGVSNSFIDAINEFVNLGDFEDDDYTLLSDSTTLSLALGGVDSLDADPDVRTTFQWNSYEFVDSSIVGFEGGKSGIPDDYDELIDSVIGVSADNTGIYAFQNRERFNNTILATPGFDQSPVIRAAIALCEAKGDMWYIADTPGGIDLEKGLSSIEIVDWHNGDGFGNSAPFNSSYASIFHAWQRTRDVFNGVNHWVPYSVLGLEQIAASDNASDVWIAPAGFRRGTLIRSQGTQEGGENTQGDRDLMYSGGNAVNPIVNFPNQGLVVFGQRTLQRNPSALDRINVRRMLIYVKRASAEAVRVELFEPLDDILFGAIQNRLEPIFREVQNRRGLNNFQIALDGNTTTDLNRENSEVVGYILLEPTKAAEKIILNFIVTAQGASFSEALTQAGVV